MLATTSSGSNGDDGENAGSCNGDKLGRKYLYISAISCAFERLFSTSGNIVILPSKAALKPDKVNMLTFWLVTYTCDLFICMYAHTLLCFNDFDNVLQLLATYHNISSYRDIL